MNPEEEKISPKTKRQSSTTYAKIQSAPWITCKYPNLRVRLISKIRKNSGSNPPGKTKTLKKELTKNFQYIIIIHDNEKTGLK